MPGTDGLCAGTRRAGQCHRAGRYQIRGYYERNEPIHRYAARRQIRAGGAGGNYFQSNEECRVAILSIIAASTGITLTAAHMVIFAELTWTPSIMIQAEDRAHRIGQEHECVNIHYLYGPDTIDEVLFKMLNQKQNIFSNTLDNMVKNMEVKNTYKKIGDFEKGKDDLDVNINNKRSIVTESGKKNMTLNNFVFKKNKEKNNEEKDNNKEKGLTEDKLNLINIHKKQSRQKLEYISNKIINDDSDNDNDMNDLNTNANDEISNPFIRERLAKNNIEEDNQPTKDKNKNKKSSKKK